MEHLHLHTKYSCGEAIGSSEDYAKLAGEGSVLAITDSHTLSGIVSHQSACSKYGIKPIFGAEVRVRPGRNLTILSENNTGLMNLFKITDGDDVDFDTLSRYSEGLICLSGDYTSPLHKPLIMGNKEEATKNFGIMKDIFGDKLFIELIDNGYAEQTKLNESLLRAAKFYGLKSVKTNDVRYPKKESFEAFLVLACDKFSRSMPYGGIPGIVNGNWLTDLQDPVAREIGERCTTSISTNKPILPEFECPEGFDSPIAYIEHICVKRMRAIGIYNQEYIERLKYELSVISNMGFEGYFLIVWDFIRWSKERGISVGPGRGSGAGSLVAYALEITDVDPIVYGLLFERFLNPERVSMPDFDIDFSQKRRGEVIEYVKRKYGEAGVSYISTFSELKGKSSWQCAGRVMGVEPLVRNSISTYFGDDANQLETDKISDIFDENGVVGDSYVTKYEPLKRAIDNNDFYRKVMVMARDIEGAYKSVGKHAAGVLITGGDISKIVPTTHIDGERVCQLDKDDAEKLGAVKFDFLGLKELDVIKYALSLIEGQGKSVPRLTGLNLNDKKTYELLSTGNTHGVFQVSSDGLSAFLRQLQPESFNDIVAATALYRPGPKDVDMHLTYMRRKLGEEPVSYDHPSLMTILGETYGVIVYQEQVMALARLLCGYSYGEADLLRRAIGKKKKSEMDKQKPLFINAGISNGYEEPFMEHMWELIETFSRYGFNKSHSVAYSIITYHTAYLKANFTAELIAAQLQIRGDKLEEVTVFLKDAHRFGIEVLMPNVSRGAKKFRVYNGKIIYGMMYIRGVSERVAELIEKHGQHIKKLKDVFDYLKPTMNDLKGLVYSGAMDHLYPKNISIDLARASMIVFGPDWIKQGRKAKTGQVSLFSEDQLPSIAFRTDGVTALTYRERLDLEKEYTGDYITGHPVLEFKKMSDMLGFRPIDRINASDEVVSVVGLITKSKRHIDKKENVMCFLEIEDHTKEVIPLTVFSRTYEEIQDIIQEGEIVYVTARLSNERGKLEGIVEAVERARS